MSLVTSKEISRQYRVLRQMIDMHATLSDQYKFKALLLDISILVCAVLLCATAFADEFISRHTGWSNDTIRIILGIASIFVFVSSLIALCVNWKGKATGHKEAVRKLTDLLFLFRKEKREGSDWPDECREILHTKYGDITNDVVPIPDAKFNALKSKYIRKVELSKMIDTNPGCPVFVLRYILLSRSINKALGIKIRRKKRRNHE